MILRRRTNRDLPEEIMLVILTRLPVKSLLRFRCICKSWYSSIANPNFISTHFNNNHHDAYTQARVPNVSFFHSHSHEVCTLASNRTFETIFEFRIPFTFHSSFPRILGSCNGILCFSDFFMSACNDIYLLNPRPNIRKFKRLPDTCLTQLSNLAHGFGYDSLNNDYEVVRISLTRAEPMLPPEAEVYSLSSDSWKRIGVGFSWRPIDFRSLRFNNYLTFPFVSEQVHWLIELVKEGNGQDGHYTDMILSFDVNSEQFKVLPLPDEGSCTMKCLMSFKEKLALFKFDIRLSFSICNIWVTREYGVFDSWNKFYVVPVQSFFNIIGFTKYGLLLIRNMPSLVSTNSELERMF